MNTPRLPSGESESGGMPAAPRPPPPARPPPPRPPRPFAAVIVSPSQSVADESQRARVFAAGLITTISGPASVALRYQNRPSGAQVGATVPPITVPASAGARNCRAWS